MIERLLRLSLGHRWLVLSLALALLVVGLYRSAQMPVDVFPDLTAPRVTVITEVSGMATEEVEQLVTFQVETAVNGAAGVRRVRSASAPGISLVWVEFDWDTETTLARQRVTERLQGLAGRLPPAAQAPVLAPDSSVMGEISFVAMTSSKLDSMALRRVADLEVRRRLLAVQGVSQVVAIGGEVKQYQVQVDPHRVERYQLTLADVVEALRAGNRNANGGYVVDRGQESVIRVLGRAQGLEQLEALVVATHGGSPVRLRDIAKVEVGPAVARGTASYRASPAVMLSVIKQPGADTASTTRRVDATIAEIEGPLEARGVKIHQDVFRQKDFIDTAIANLVSVLRDGAILVIAVLFLFLWSFRPTMISLLAIPLSLLSAALVLDLLGLTLDTMTLGGLAIAMGELVDDAIVDVENVLRRLRERATLPEAKRPPILKTVYTASIEIRSAVVSATAVLMLVFAPLLVLDGIEGRLLEPLAIAYLVAILASLVVAMTITPVLCAFLLPKAAERRSNAESPLLRWLVRGYRPLLGLSLASPAQVAVAAAFVVAVGFAALSNLGRTFLPEFNEGNLTISMVLPPGTSLKESDALGAFAERALLADPGVGTVARRTGRAEADEHVQGVESSEIEVRIRRDDPRTREQLFNDLRERLKAVPGAQFNLGQPISHRIDHMLSGQRAALSVKVFGDKLSDLRKTAEQIKAVASDVPGLVDVGVEQIVEIPQVTVRVDPHAASNYGLSSGRAAEAVGIALWGVSPTQIYEEGAATDVVVKYQPGNLDDTGSIAALRIPTPQGALVPIASLAEVKRTTGPNYVLRENVKRRIVVTANISGKDMSGSVETLRKRIAAQVKRPAGVHIEYAGQFERAAATQRRLVITGILVLIGIAFIVGATLRNWRRTLIVLVNLPLAIAGGVVGVYLAGGVLSVATTIGFITLFGIATRNGILLATRTRDLELIGMPRKEAVEMSALERLAPILMTALTAALGLLPLAAALGQPGSEIQAPMALVILTGLVTSTTLNMLVVPSFLAKWGGTTHPDALPEPPLVHQAE